MFAPQKFAPRIPRTTYNGRNEIVGTTNCQKMYCHETILPTHGIRGEPERKRCLLQILFLTSRSPCKGQDQHVNGPANIPRRRPYGVGLRYGLWSERQHGLGPRPGTAAGYFGQAFPDRMSTRTREPLRPCRTHFSKTVSGESLRCSAGNSFFAPCFFYRAEFHTRNILCASGTGHECYGDSKYQSLQYHNPVGEIMRRGDATGSGETWPAPVAHSALRSPLRPSGRGPGGWARAGRARAPRPDASRRSRPRTQPMRGSAAPRYGPLRGGWTDAVEFRASHSPALASLAADFAGFDRPQQRQRCFVDVRHRCRGRGKG
jgi:hypothetical protein